MNKLFINIGNFLLRKTGNRRIIKKISPVNFFQINYILCLAFFDFLNTNLIFFFLHNYIFNNYLF